jgi:hypothetical protein
MWESGRIDLSPKENKLTYSSWVHYVSQYLLSLDQISSRASHEAINSGKRSGEPCRSHHFWKGNMAPTRQQNGCLVASNISAPSFYRYKTLLLKASPILSGAVDFQDKWEASCYNFDWTGRKVGSLRARSEWTKPTCWQSVHGASILGYRHLCQIRASPHHDELSGIVWLDLPPKL